jgi:hypothetical protein
MGRRCSSAIERLPCGESQRAVTASIPGGLEVPCRSHTPLTLRLDCWLDCGFLALRRLHGWVVGLGSAHLYRLHR